MTEQFAVFGDKVGAIAMNSGGHNSLFTSDKRSRDEVTAPGLEDTLTHRPRTLIDKALDPLKGVGEILVLLSLQ